MILDARLIKHEAAIGPNKVLKNGFIRHLIKQGHTIGDSKPPSLGHQRIHAFHNFTK